MIWSYAVAGVEAVVVEDDPQADRAGVVDDPVHDLQAGEALEEISEPAAAQQSGR